jgi:hypothetical protein
MSCEVLTTVAVNITVFWNVTPFSLADTYRRFRGITWHFIQYTRRCFS